MAGRVAVSVAQFWPSQDECDGYLLEHFADMILEYSCTPNKINDKFNNLLAALDAELTRVSSSNNVKAKWKGIKLLIRKLIKEGNK